MKYNTGFTLIELSITLVIIGLLAGGIVAGNNLIRAAEMRSVISELDQYRSAILTFQDRYIELPGDMSKATLFWGKNTAKCNSAPGTAQPFGTCNGNSNGAIGHNSDYVTDPIGSAEILLIWQHLSLSGMIEGSYTGVSGPNHAISHTLHGINVPKSKVSGAAWNLENRMGSGSTFEYINPAKILKMEFGAQEESGNYDSDGPVLTTIEAYNVDKKIDDGLPGKGMTIALYWNNACADATSNTDYNSKYRLTDSQILCALSFNLFE